MEKKIWRGKDRRAVVGGAGVGTVVWKKAGGGMRLFPRGTWERSVAWIWWRVVGAETPAGPGCILKDTPVDLLMDSIWEQENKGEFKDDPKTVGSKELKAHTENNLSLIEESKHTAFILSRPYLNSCLAFCHGSVKQGLETNPELLHSRWYHQGWWPPSCLPQSTRPRDT